MCIYTYDIYLYSNKTGYKHVSIYIFNLFVGKRNNREYQKIICPRRELNV